MKKLFALLAIFFSLLTLVFFTYTPKNPHASNTTNANTEKTNTKSPA